MDMEENKIQENFSSKSYLYLGLFSLFLGLFGGDRFYVGRKITATLKLILGVMSLYYIFYFVPNFRLPTNIDILTIQFFDVVLLIATLTIYFWFIFDLVLVLFGRMRDCGGKIIKRGTSKSNIVIGILIAISLGFLALDFVQ